jgi:hypothetical protein
MLVPFYMLRGAIDAVKEVPLTDGRVERTYEDERGNRAIVVRDAPAPHLYPALYR